MTTKDETAADTTHHVIIERQWNDDLAITFPDKKAAEQALESSTLVDYLCAEDCLDAYTEKNAPSWAKIMNPNDITFVTIGEKKS